MPCHSPSRPTGTWIAAGAMLCTALGACGPDRMSTRSTFPFDHRERHPIVLTDAPETLDVFAVAHGGLDRREREDVAAFGVAFRKSGKGGIVRAHVPQGRDSQRALGEIRQILGVPVAVASYAAADRRLAAPIRLSFPRLQAQVATECGRWPKDLGMSDFRHDAENEPYWNLGCATRSNMASQTADPIDLVRGRPEGPADTIRRMTVMEKWREGADSSTDWKKESQTVSGSVNTD